MTVIFTVVFLIIIYNTAW